MKKTSSNNYTSPASSQRQGRHWLFAAVTVFMTCTVCFFSIGANSAEDTEGQIELTRKALEEWVDYQRDIAKAKHDLTLAKEMLQAEIKAVKGEIGSLHEKIKETEDKIAELDKNRVEKVKANSKLKKASESLEPILFSLENGVKQLLKQVPPQMADHVKLLSQQIPDDPEETKLSVAQRFQNVVGILDQIDKFHRQISTFTEVQTLEDGSAVEVASVYIGLGQGYYVSANGSVAGIGSATENGWTWTPANQVAPQILEVIEILENKKVASYVQVPVEIQ